ncbi:multiple sugar transport system permease protein [Anaerocolumna jejuensis DSM 15929]|uniref:Multiple sugar transport system permease protein n=1 Tax=Anaerocolumna jejuensis DSM 15929 TaxID=1121322 RepID=A0A1M6WQG8_9FIRM|nr:sugar ABC transporter permease [Anaerocolumna jejuensis]SHK95967.1 multiple sugar transport system permease protein [Anaerocolumna jejuensis DSM 15929]
MSSARSAAQKEPFNFKKWLGRRKVQRALVIVSFIFIPIVLLFTFTYLPFFNMIRFSFYDMKYIGGRTFVGFDNYKEIFTRPDILQTFKLSLYYMAASVIQLALALYFATLLSFKTRGGGFFKGAIFFPYLVCGIAVGFIFKFFYTRGFVFDTVLSWIGFNTDSLPYWLKNTKINNISLAATSIWRYMGQNMVLFIGAIMSVDSDLYEASSLDGANKWQQFRFIIMPSIKTIIMLNLILSITGSLSAFEPPYVITGGTFGTSTYFLMMHNIAHRYQKLGLASAMAVALMVIIVLVTILQKVGFSLAGDNNSDVSKKTARKLGKSAKEGIR